MSKPESDTAIRALKSVRSLSGHDARCHVCWEAIYTLWIDRDDDPAGRCMHGHKQAHECPEAMARARTAGQMAKLRAQGLIK
jgi:hypothetical protein